MLGRFGARFAGYIWEESVRNMLGRFGARFTGYIWEESGTCLGGGRGYWGMCLYSFVKGF